MWVFSAGVPLPCGGANVEQFDTVLLWRKLGVNVASLVFDSCRCGKSPAVEDPASPMIQRFYDAGVAFAHGGSGYFGDVPDLEGSIIVAFRNQHVLHNWHELRAMGCKLIWSPTMCRLWREERICFAKTPPTAVHFQSRYQESCLRDQFAAFGCRDLRVIHGAFGPLEFRPQQRVPEWPFMIGRLARASHSKWSPHLWQILASVRSACIDARMLCQGWGPEVGVVLGDPPPHAACFPENTISTPEFMAACHAMICANWSVAENWPRVGLEAMSAGVPLVVDDRGGWREMCQDAAVYCATPVEFSDAMIRLARDEEHRQEIIRRGRERALQLAGDESVGRAWLQWFADLA